MNQAHKLACMYAMYLCEQAHVLTKLRAFYCSIFTKLLVLLVRNIGNFHWMIFQSQQMFCQCLKNWTLYGPYLSHKKSYFTCQMHSQAFAIPLSILRNSMMVRTKVDFFLENQNEMMISVAALKSILVLVLLEVQKRP